MKSRAAHESWRREIKVIDQLDRIKELLEGSFLSRKQVLVSEMWRKCVRRKRKRGELQRGCCSVALPHATCTDRPEYRQCGNTREASAIPRHRQRVLALKAAEFRTGCTIHPPVPDRACPLVEVQVRRHLLTRRMTKIGKEAMTHVVWQLL